MSKIQILKNTWRNKRRTERKTYFLDLLGGKCVCCGSTESLQFDHIDPETKNFNISSKLDHNFESLEQEVMLCQLLCASCHGKKTRKDNGFKGYEHGTQSMYNNLGCRCTDCRAANTIFYREKRIS